MMQSVNDTAGAYRYNTATIYMYICVYLCFMGFVEVTCILNHMLDRIYTAMTADIDY